MSSDATSDLITALATASSDVKQDALRVLRGEAKAECLSKSIQDVEPFITIKEAAQRLGVSTCSLWRWKIPQHELGGKSRVRISEVSEYLESKIFKKRAAELREERRQKGENQ